MTRLLTQTEFKATFTPPMTMPPDDAAVPCDFWSYFDTIPPAHFQGHDCSAGEVHWVWRDASGQYEHVLVNSRTANVFMVLVLDLKTLEVYGHRLLDLNAEYGLNLPGAAK